MALPWRLHEPSHLLFMVMQRHSLCPERDRTGPQNNVGALFEFSIFFLRESQRLTHGTKKSFVLAFSRHLGTVRLVNVEWQYDHDIDPLDPLKVCVLLLCTDSIHVQTLAVSSLISEPP